MEFPSRYSRQLYHQNFHLEYYLPHFLSLVFIQIAGPISGIPPAASQNLPFAISAGLVTLSNGLKFSVLVIYINNKKTRHI